MYGLLYFACIHYYLLMCQMFCTRKSCNVPLSLMICDRNNFSMLIVKDLQWCAYSIYYALSCPLCCARNICNTTRASWAALAKALTRECDRCCARITFTTTRDCLGCARNDYPSKMTKVMRPPKYIQWAAPAKKTDAPM